MELKKREVSTLNLHIAKNENCEESLIISSFPSLRKFTEKLLFLTPS